MTTFLSQVAQITPSLYLSGFVGASEATVIKYGITCIITVCKEVPKLSIPFVESIKLDVLDKPNEQLERYFDYVADKINDVAERKGACLVHCVAGISRSASMCIVYLMKHHNMSLRDAHDLVKSKRHFIRPNLGFWKQLVDYERKLFGKNSIKLITSSIGLIPDIYENEVKNMIWSSPNGLVVTNSNTHPNNTANGNITNNKVQTTTTSYKQQQQQHNGGQIIKPSLSSVVPTASLSNSSVTVVPTTTAVLSINNNSNNQGAVGTNRPAGNRSYYQTTYSTSYCAQKR